MLHRSRRFHLDAGGELVRSDPLGHHVPLLIHRCPRWDDRRNALGVDLDPGEPALMSVGQRRREPLTQELGAVVLARADRLDPVQPRVGVDELGAASVRRRAPRLTPKQRGSRVRVGLPLAPLARLERRPRGEERSDAEQDRCPRVEPALTPFPRTLRFGLEVLAEHLAEDVCDLVEQAVVVVVVAFRLGRRRGGIHERDDRAPLDQRRDTLTSSARSSA
jgi:hypothetical protein